MGRASYNKQLGLARAKAVCRLLVQKGAKAHHVLVSSAGESHPRANNATAAGRALNRRVELSVRYR